MNALSFSRNGSVIRFVAFILFCSAVLAAIGPISPAPRAYAAGNTYYVGGSGASDNNPGTSTQPFATIQKASTVATAGDNVKIRSGTYRETVTPANSGTAGNPITYEPDTGADVTISGADTADGGWSVYSGSIYQKNISLPVTGYNDHITSNTTLMANQVFVNGKMMIEARWPNVSNSDDLMNRNDFRDGTIGTWTDVPQLRINTGGPFIDYQQLADKPYSAGSWGYEGFSGVYTTTNTIVNTYSVGDALKDARYGAGLYRINKPNGTYQIKMDWAEIVNNNNSRRFNVKIQGVQVLTNFDVFTLAGGKDRGYEVVFNNIAVTNGQIVIEFIPIAGAGDPFISQIEVNYTKPTTLVDAAIPNISGGWVGGQIWVNGWFISQTAPITAHSGTSITFDIDVGQPFRNYYYLTGKLGALDAEKEWFYDGAKLYLRAPGSGSPTNVEVKKRNFAFDLSNRSYITIKNLKIFAASITSNASSSNLIVDGIQAKYINHFFTLPTDKYYEPTWAYSQSGNSHMDETGIRLMGPNNLIQNSVIEYGAGNGIAIGGANSVVHNNLVHDVSYGGKFESGIWPAPNLSNNTVGVPQTITNNTVYRTGRSAIHGIYMNKDIGYNNFYDFGLINSDLGALYTDCWDRISGCPPTNISGTRIHHNWLHDAKAPDRQASGVYFDQLTGAGAQVDHNVFWNNRENDAYNQRNSGVKWYNNTFASHDPELSFLSYDISGATADIFRNNIYRSFVHRGAWTSPWNENYGAGDNSINKNTNPLFVNESGLDFRLQSGSPARDTGVVIAGVTDGYVGSLPDKGAYEFGGTNWVAGYVAPGGGGSPVKLTGTAFGTSGTWNPPGDTYDKAFDGSTSTFFDSTTLTGAYTGIDLGAGNARKVTSIKFYPRTTDPYRMIGGKFQGSNTSSSSGFVDLYTIPSQPAVAWTEVTVTDNTAYRYLRYVGGANSYGNVAEIEFWGETSSDTQAPTAPTNLASPAKTTTTVDLTWTASTDNVGVTGYEIYYGGSTLCGTSATTSFTCTGLTPATAYSFTVKAKDAANNLSAASGALNVTTNSSGGSPTVYEAENGTFGGGGQQQSASNASNGAVVGNLNANGAYSQVGNVNGGAGGNATLVIRFANGYTSSRTLSLYVNGVKQQQLTFPVTGGWNTFADTASLTVALNAGTGNTIRIQKDAADTQAADIDKYTVTTSGSSPVKLTGTAFGTSGTWNPPGDTYDKAFDGSTSTFFDSTTLTGAYTGIDLGSGNAKRVTSIKFYPRTTDPYRMIGGKFQGSNTSSSSGFVDLYTISSQPAVSWTEVTVTDTTSYRYLRYVGGTGSYGNVAEIEFWGQ